MHDLSLAYLKGRMHSFSLDASTPFINFIKYGVKPNMWLTGRLYLVGSWIIHIEIQIPKQVPRFFMICPTLTLEEYGCFPYMEGAFP